MKTQESARRRPGCCGKAVVLLLAIFCASTGAMAQSGTTQAAASQNCPPRQNDCRDDFQVGIFTGLSLDSFAARELKLYLNPDESGNVREHLNAGFDFAYRLAGTSTSNAQVWVYGETVHGAQSGEVDCSTADNRDTEFCRVTRMEALNEAGVLGIFRQSTSLEGFMGLRAELWTLRKGTDNPSKFYVKGQLGFLTTANKGGDVIDMRHVGVGLVMSAGTFQDSYLEIGYARNDLFQPPTNHSRLMLDALISISPTEQAKARPFLQIVIDSDFGDGPDDIQTFFGLDIDILEIFK
jgi:hypothetical protein